MFAPRWQIFTAIWENPKNVVNHVLQQNGKDAVNALARFLYNSSVGVGGLFDVAKDIDLEEREADFGQTLRAYGMNHTAYIVLPIFGPSSVADVPGQAADTVSFPPYYLKDTAAKASIGAVNGVRRRSELLDFTAIAEETALDEYSFVRDTYEEIRANEAKKRGKSLFFAWRRGVMNTGIIKALGLLFMTQTRQTPITPFLLLGDNENSGRGAVW